MAKASILIAGSSHPELANEISKKVDLPLFPVSIARFPDGEMRVQLGDSVAGKQAFIIQSIAKKPNELLIETLLLVDALRRGAAEQIVIVSPYFAYARQNVQEDGGSSVAARLFADFLKLAGVDGLITMDLHAELVKSFYDFPVEHLSARHLFVEALERDKALTGDCILVGPDFGSAKLIAKYAEELKSSIAFIEKRRIDARKVTMLSLIGEVKNKIVLLADDVCSTAGTLTSAATVCQGKGAKSIIGVVSHGLFVEDALDVIVKSPIERLYVSDSVQLDPKVLACPKIHVVSVANLFAAALSKQQKLFQERF
ncbi:MAG: ribose-phosphate pyrophosphokinase [Verrucomicrobia bacterium]|nr:ribose-phosphate pyrophosphokinase [Verrucomicrobiota bacterium]MBS0637122.1 ribose-phosphate pyrophosphokinase [Verrucomicrobiota bacterium]